jgi:hypothetical protein
MNAEGSKQLAQLYCKTCGVPWRATCEAGPGTETDGPEADL